VSEFDQQVRQNWIGKPVSVTKTEPTPQIRFTLEGTRVVGPDEVDPVIRQRYPDNNARFLVFFGDGTMHALIVHVDDGTVYDIRDHRLVILSDDEVVQVSQVH
jgi:hypothetical protein